MCAPCLAAACLSAARVAEAGTSRTAARTAERAVEDFIVDSGSRSRKLNKTGADR